MKKMKKTGISASPAVGPKASSPAAHNSVLREKGGEGAASGANMKVTKGSGSSSTFKPATGK